MSRPTTVLWLLPQLLVPRRSMRLPPVPTADAVHARAGLFARAGCHDQLVTSFRTPQAPTPCRTICAPSSACPSAGTQTLRLRRRCTSLSWAASASRLPSSGGGAAVGSWARAACSHGSCSSTCGTARALANCRRQRRCEAKCWRSWQSKGWWCRCGQPRVAATRSMTPMAVQRWWRVLTGAALLRCRRELPSSGGLRPCGRNWPP
mmetsp:Transcript_8751/g.30994  ORF Transcript_8751/g.30994 Transcript_8751/m.30994 type:complete len:206 (+) Transcript_8751:321-938(+)